MNKYDKVLLAGHLLMLTSLILTHITQVICLDLKGYFNLKSREGSQTEVFLTNKPKKLFQNTELRDCHKPF